MLALKFGRSFSTKVTLKPLPYSLNALEPVISENLMSFHYGKHHQTYVNNLNNLLAEKDKAEKEENFLKVTSLTNGIAFNGGGNYNHTFFWESLAPINDGGGVEPTGELRNAIDDAWGSLDSFKSDFNAQTALIQGSGWGWLCYNKNTGGLSY
jgi:Fe-Mn family superoxide dismutase